MSEGGDDNFKMGISLWLSFCLFICVWFLSRFVRGRRQLHNNLHVIEDGLRRMQEEIERRQRENSITYGEGSDGLNEINDFLQKHAEEKKLKENEKEEEKLKSMDNTDKEEKHNLDEPETNITEEVVTDKKND